MARMSRVVAPGYPHHITQRGNRRQRTFFCACDYEEYLGLLGGFCSKYHVEVWGYCLMPNHIHVIAVPPDTEALRRVFGELHKRYTRTVNEREGWKGYLWQGRFASYVMDENYLMAAARYVDLNPVRAGLCARAEDYPWSSARAHLLGLKDRLARFEKIDAIAGDWREFLRAPLAADDEGLLRARFSTGRPLGNEVFIRELELRLQRRLLKRRPGPPAGLLAQGS